MRTPPRLSSLARLAVAIGLLWPVTAAALEPGRRLTQYPLDGWSTREGLPQDKVQAIAQTPDGFLWVGTGGGVARFDGVRFVPFGPPGFEHLRTASSRALFVSRDGTLWIATDAGEIVAVRDGTPRRVVEATGGAPTFVRALAERPDGSLLIGAAEGLFTTGSGRPTRLDVAAEMVFDIAVEAGGDAWVASATGTFHVRQADVRRYGRGDGLPSSRSQAVEIGPDGAIWIALSPGGVVRRHGDRWTRYDQAHGLPGEFVRALHVDGRGQVFAGTWNGLARLVNGRFEVLGADDGLRDGAVNSIFEDREGSLWVGTRGSGLHRLTDAPVLTYNRDDGLTTSDAQLVFADASGRIWAGVGDRGAVFLDGHRWRPVEGDADLESSLLHTAAQDTQGRVWLGGSAGLFHVNGRRPRRLPLPGARQPGTVYSLIAPPDGSLWAVTSNGLVHVVSDTAVLVPFDEETFGALDALLGFTGDTLWIGTPLGLVALAQGKADLRWRAPDPLSEPETLLADADGTLWLGTSAGIVHLRDGQVTTVRRAHGLPDDLITDLLVDGQDRIWAGTHRGLVRLDRAAFDAAARDGTLVVRHLGLEDGLRSNYVDDTGAPSGSRAPDGRLWFATTQGISVVDPALVERDLVPNALVDDVIVDGAPADLRRPVHVPPGTREITLRFTSTSLRASRRVVFRYRLEGFDESWRSTGTAREVRYSNLSPGDYRLTVQASLDGSAWSEAAPRVAITIEPRLYQTLWFKALCLAALALASVGGAMWRIGLAQARARELSALVDERTRALRLEVEERAQAEQALRLSEVRYRTLADELEQRVRLRTSELQAESHEHRRTASELLVAKQAAEAASRVKSAFLQTMSHELRTPLNAVIGYGELVGDELRERGATDLVDDTSRIGSAARHLLRLIDHMLDFTNIESGQLPLHVTLFDVETLARAVADKAGPLAATNRNRLEVEIGEGLGEMLSDAARVEQVLLSLLDNAGKFTSDGVVTLSVSRERAQEDDWVVFTVGDTGIGIDPDQMDRLFEVFVQGDASTSRRFAGAGLGLALCQRLCAILGGYVRVESTVGRGTTAFVHLPAEVPVDRVAKLAGPSTS